MYGQISMDKWTSGAAYDQWMGRWSRLVAEAFVGWLDLLQNSRWLDVCCGSGVLTEAIVNRRAPAQVVGMDASPQQISYAREYRSQPNVTFETGDAMHLGFNDASFDAIVCGLGLNYLPDPTDALREMRRVAAPQGTVAIYVWDYAHGARFLREFWDAAAACDSEAPQHDQATRFTHCNPEAMQKLFAQAGLEEIKVQALDITTKFTSFDDYWQPLLSGQGSAPNYLASRSEATRNAIRELLRTSLPTNPDGVIELPARAWAVRGQRN
jgi:ubiquinone/menaquinone biosynthesis C-methylase UbiE